MVSPKPIETAYAGCRFRSRLEARWAVFFDALEIEWQYEAEGFESPGGRYLPDFWLPEVGHWVEVKGIFTPSDFQRTSAAVWQLREPPDKQVMPQLLVLGPVPRPGTAWTHVRLDVIAREFLLWQQTFFGLSGGVYRTVSIDLPLVFSKGAIESATDVGALEWFCRESTNAAAEPRLAVDPTVDGAYRAARSARFEFGESG